MDVFINFIGMSLDDYSDFVCLFKPYEIYKCKFAKELSYDCCYSGLIEEAFSEYIQQCESNTYSKKEFYMYSQQYIKYGEYLVGCPPDKTIREILSDLEIDSVSIEIFVFGGGASRQCHGYLFVVHSDEDVHKNTPHVHVKKDGHSVRYSLKTFERYKSDRCGHDYLRDEKKIIIPFLKDNQAFFMDFWDKAQKGYKMPKLGDDKVQYCEESD